MLDRDILETHESSSFEQSEGRGSDNFGWANLSGISDDTEAMATAAATDRGRWRSPAREPIRNGIESSASIHISNI